ncbi:hypothetical protein [Mycobacterium sp.]|uniref:hypothetical protein n=1 Tax=Mycobacterium sp. TaxID=1785 RepID=UPI002D58B684|nr:hypothetical protein [Mycobacterium sp.]HZA10320.1 hypothetical protein [Mycobacterium sp.]
MAFKLTYRDGQEDDYDDSTKWEVEAGVLKMGRQPGEWTVFVSPSHWATIEVGASPAQDKDKPKDKDTDKGDDQNKNRDRNHDEDS